MRVSSGPRCAFVVTEAQRAGRGGERYFRADQKCDAEIAEIAEIAKEEKTLVCSPR
jgi:hypothetical protein